MKNITFYVREKGYSKGEGQAFEVTYTFANDYPKEVHLMHYDKLIDSVKGEYPEAELIEALIPIKPATKGFTKEKLLAIGQEVASGWGGVCTGVKACKNIVQFNCNEYGEKFNTTLTYDEIKKDYAYMLK